MALDKQCYIFSIGTDSFYDEKESYIHDRMTKLYKLLWKGKSKSNRPFFAIQAKGNQWTQV